MTTTKRYHKFGRTDAFVHETEKAYMVELVTGYFGRGHERYVWIPKSAVILLEPTDAGVIGCLIADWIFRAKRIQPGELRGMAYKGIITSA